MMSPIGTSVMTHSDGHITKIVYMTSEMYKHENLVYSIAHFSNRGCWLAWMHFAMVF